MIERLVYPFKFMFALVLAYAYLAICFWCYILRAVIVIPIWLLCREKPFNIFFMPNWKMLGKMFKYPEKEEPVHVVVDYWY